MKSIKLADEITEEVVWTYEKNPVDVDDKRLELIENGQIIEQPEYIQVFSSKYGFIPNLSILDLLFNLGPETLSYLKSDQFNPTQPCGIFMTPPWLFFVIL